MRDPSAATETDFQVELPPGKEWLPFQPAGVEYALQRAATLIADPPGLGKTAQAFGVINADDTINTVLIICPAYLKAHWARQYEEWCVADLTVGIAGSVKEKTVEDGKTKYRNTLKWPDTQVVIVNYDLLPRFYKQIRAMTWDLLIADEAHYLTNVKAIRTKNIIGYRGGKKPDWIEPIQARRKLFLTGTPLTARPVDLWPLLRVLDPKGLGADYMRFVRRYCDAKNNGFGLDVSGASNLEELQQIMRKRFMVRRDKMTVLKDLPPKRRQIVPLPKAGLERITEEELDAFQRLLSAFERTLGRPPNQEEVWRWESLSAAIEDKFQNLSGLEYQEVVGRLGSDAEVAFEQMSKAREQLARAKVKMVVEYVNSLLDQGEKVVLFCVHKAVASAFYEQFGDSAVLVTGALQADKRQHAVDRFQTDPNCRTLIGNIQAAGTGFTMTAASHVVFAEFSWLPSDMEQAEDRLWRIGQQNDVTVHHLVVEDSLDAKMVRVLLERQEMIAKALDKRALRSQ
jgi:SWI/SNF-related matrix-associated actin-dependent regulator 1 of chromatin subfamily A